MANERTHLVSNLTLNPDNPEIQQAPRRSYHGTNTPIIFDDPPTELSEASNIASGYASIPSGYTSVNSDVGTVNLHELLSTLERASAIIKAHIDQNKQMFISAGQKRPRPLIPRWITSYLLLITVVWQGLNIGLLETLETIKHDNSTAASDNIDLVSNIVMTIFQLAHLVLIFFVTLKLAKQVIHRTASGSLLAQSYLSTVLVCAGLYTLEYRFNPSAFKNTSDDNQLRPVLLFLRMLFFSVSNATLCGTSEVEPVKWYSAITVGLQMLGSFVYFASILSLSLIPRKPSKFDPVYKAQRSFTKRIRRCIFREND